MPTQLEAEVGATYWLVSLAPCWRSTVYTFSDNVYDELGPAREASERFQIAGDVLVREQQPDECWTVQSSRRPDVNELEALKLKPADAGHVADAIALDCSAFLTNDKQLRGGGARVEARWALRLRRPSEFLVDAVLDGAPWPCCAPWPWESLRRIHGLSAQAHWPG
jgi:hypothetical protein